MIISIYSSKGGVGKSTVALELAESAGKILNTVIIEFDFSPGSFVSILDLDRQRNIYEAVNGNIEWALQRPDGKSFDVIVGGYPDTSELIKSGPLTELLRKLNDMYDIVIVDVQPTFIEGCIDIFNLSDYILIVTTDDFSVISRVMGNLDWAKLNSFVDESKINYIINMKKGKLKYVNMVDLKYPILYEIPYIKNLNPFGDKRFLSHTKNILSKIMPDAFNQTTKKGFSLFNIFKKNKVSSNKRGNTNVKQNIKAFKNKKNSLDFDDNLEGDSESNDMNFADLTKYDNSTDTENDDRKPNNILNFDTHKNQDTDNLTDNFSFKDDSLSLKKNEDIEDYTFDKEDLYMSTFKNKVYINTGVEGLDNVLKSRLNNTNDINESSVIIIYSLLNEKFIKDALKSGKKIIVLSDKDDKNKISTAHRLGIDNIVYGPIDPDEVVSVVNSLTNDAGKSHDIVNAPNVSTSNNRFTLNKEVEPINDNEDNSLVFDSIISPEDIAEYEQFLTKIKDIIIRSATYVNKISKLQNEIKEKDAKIQELNDTIENYRKKEEERKILLQKLLV